MLVWLFYYGRMPFLSSTLPIYPGSGPAPSPDGGGLFAIIIDCLIYETRRETPWIMMFADAVLICTSEYVEVELRN